jgi:transposase
MPVRYDSKSVSTAKFVAKMEDVLCVYERPYDPDYPVVCIDEKSKELRGHTPGREPIAPRPSPSKEEATDQREDYEYKRGGMVNLFMVCEPLRGWRRVAVTNRRTAQDFAHLLKQVVDEDYAGAKKIVLVTDNLNTHTMWSLYQTYEPEEAKRILERIEWHFTPEHGSWLNMAELELSVLHRQCLNRRIPDEVSLQQECNAWVAERNRAKVTIDWQFTNNDARIKLKSLYPIIITATPLLVKYSE